MGQRTSEPGLNDSDGIEDLFDPMLSETLDDLEDDLLPKASNKNRLAELRKRAELRLEEKRMRAELDYMDLDWEET